MARSGAVGKVEARPDAPAPRSTRSSASLAHLPADHPRPPRLQATRIRPRRSITRGSAPLATDGSDPGSPRTTPGAPPPPPAGRSRPLAGQVHQPVQVRAVRERLGLEPADLAGRRGGVVSGPPAHNRVQRGIDAPALSVVEVL